MMMSKKTASEFNALSNDENGLSAPNDEGGLLPDNDEVIALDLIPPPDGAGKFNTIGG